MSDKDEFQGLMTMQPDVRFVNVKPEEDPEDVAESVMLYLSQFCPNVDHLKTTLILGDIISFKQGYVNLTVLEIVFDQHFYCRAPTKEEQQARRAFIDSAIIHVTSLPKLSVLEIKDSAVGDDRDEASRVDEWNEMHVLKSLEMFDTGDNFVNKLIKYCPEILTNVYLHDISSEGIAVLIKDERFPNLNAVGFELCEFSQEEMSKFVLQFGSQLEYLHIKHTEFMPVHMRQLTDLKPSKLKVFEFCQRESCQYVDLEFGGELTRFIRQNGGQLTRLNLGGKFLNDLILEEILENCPLLIEQGEWDFTGWGGGEISPRGFYNFVDKAGPTLKVLLNIPLDEEIMSNGYIEEIAWNCPNIEVLALLSYSMLRERLARNLKKMKSKYLKNS